MFSLVKAGVLFGLREFFHAPRGFCRIRKRLLKSTSRSSKGHGSPSDSPTQAYYDQALHRQKVSAAMGERRPSSRPTDTPSRSSWGSPFSSSVDILKSLCRIWLINLLVVLVIPLSLSSLSSICHLTLLLGLQNSFWTTRFFVLQDLGLVRLYPFYDYLSGLSDASHILKAG